MPWKPRVADAEGIEASDRNGPDRIFRSSAWILGGTAVLALVWGGRISLSVLLGGVVALVNMRLLHVVAVRATSRAPGRGSFLALFGLVVRYILLFVALYVIFTAWQLSVVATVIGLSVPVLAIGLEAARALRREFGTNRK